MKTLARFYAWLRRPFVGEEMGEQRREGGDVR